MIRRSTPPMPGDAGVSLLEVVVTLAIMSILMTFFTNGILSVYQATGAAESSTVVQSQLHLAFQRLDKEIRYATWIAEPGTQPVRGSWYVEFAGRNAQTRQPECNQLRLDTARGLLQQVRWTPGSPPPEGRPAATLASDIVVPTAQPFRRQAAGSYPYATPGSSPAGASFAPDFHRLRLQLRLRVENHTVAADVTFTALNTSRDTPATNACTEGRPAP